MKRSIPALEALAKAERNLTDELDVFRSKMNIVEARMNEALRILETAQKTFGRKDAGQKTFGGMKQPVMAREFNTVMAGLRH